jgi:heavy metal sensor kinase
VRRPLSVGARLALLNAAVLAAAMLALGVLIFAVVDRALLAGADGILADEAEEMAGVLRRESLTPAALQEEFDAEAREHASEELAVRATAAGGAVVARSGSPLWGEVPPGGGAAAARSLAVPGKAHAFRLLARRVDAPALGPVDLEVAMDLAAREAALGRLLDLSAAVAGAILLTALAGGYFLARRSLAPLDRIETAARRIGAGPPGARLPLAGTADELDRLASTLNGMLGRLEEASARNLRFAGDVAHEVRTPLAALRARLETFPGDPGGDRAPGADRIEAAVREVERVEALVRSLLLICRSDEGGARVARAPLDLGDLAREAAEFFGPLAESRGIRLSVEVPGPLPAAGDAASLRRALANLVDNALLYTDRGGAVRIAGRAAAGRVRVEVEDEGCGIPAEDAGRVFERFFRSPGGRARNPGGSGLGLALVRSVARAHGGDADWRPRQGGGSVFGIEFPAGRPAPRPAAGIPA